ncbi:hypothetical protein [Actinopolymorpha pittospori]|uniref:Uncharacterized protein n=2 Tax=Actinopolymorpha pittospori TaxID=648752 RepID=A0A927RNE4_9ACTN|nr:hypothetical protein [Actinopolymorpha pittospori]MBE1609978.1 hypothetical protein [Actinopolymorpha pittospori]
MIMEDLRSLPAGPLIVAEGGLITPAMARPENQAVWLFPSRDVQVARLRVRHRGEVPWSYLQAMEPTIEQLAETGIATIAVDHLSVEEAIAEIERVFAPRIGKGPTATTVEERRSLIRQANQALVNQYASPSSRPLTTVDPDSVIRTFDCECALPECTALVELTISDAAAASAAPPPSILAIEH